MDEKNMMHGEELCDEELDKVAGGRVYLTRDGRVEIGNISDCSCHSALFFKDIMSGENGLHTIARCSDCVYWSGDCYCTNPDVAASLKG